MALDEIAKRERRVEIHCSKCIKQVHDKQMHDKIVLCASNSTCKCVCRSLPPSLPFYCFIRVSVCFYRCFLRCHILAPAFILCTTNASTQQIPNFDYFIFVFCFILCRWFSLALHFNLCFIYLSICSILAEQCGVYSDVQPSFTAAITFVVDLFGWFSISFFFDVVLCLDSSQRENPIERACVSVCCRCQCWCICCCFYLKFIFKFIVCQCYEVSA